MRRLLFIAPALILILVSPKLVGWLGAALMIGGLIFIHELGHFLAAKRMGMPVETFSLGFGPRLIGFRWRETDVRLSALPLGGYVKLAGYNPEEPEAEDPHGFLQQPFGRRMLFYSGGILANLATAVALLFVLQVDRARATPRPLPSPLLIVNVLKGGAADQAGLQPGDLVLQLGELAFPGNPSEAARPYIEARPGQAIALKVEREGRPRELVATPRSEAGKGPLGIEFGTSKVAYDRRSLAWSDVGRGAVGALTESWNMGRQVLVGFARLFTFQAKLGEIGGPITIARAGSQFAKAGWEQFLFFCAFISMNLALLNALPIPFLDGGHMAILLIEKVRRKDFSILVKERILTAGFVLLVSLMVFVLALDVWKLNR